MKTHKFHVPDSIQITKDGVLVAELTVKDFARRYNMTTAQYNAEQNYPKPSGFKATFIPGGECSIPIYEG